MGRSVPLGESPTPHSRVGGDTNIPARLRLPWNAPRACPADRQRGAPSPRATHDQKRAGYFVTTPYVPTCISLFSGAGGLDLGLMQAGFRILFANDINPVFRDTYCKNLGVKETYHVGSAAEISRDFIARV